MYQDPHKDLRSQLSNMEIKPPPDPWQHRSISIVGGLTYIGYSSDSDLLLVVSHSGRGVFNCLTGEKLDRDYEEDFELDPIKLTSPGIGSISDQTIRIAGLTGGGLSTRTKDGWKLKAIPLPWPNYSIFLVRPWKSLFDGIDAVTKLEDDCVCEVRAYGFSYTGRSFVIATTSDITIFTRNEI